VTFVDTSGWYAWLVSDDPDHSRATAWMGSRRGRLVTTDYVLDEALTLLRARKEENRAKELGQGVLAETCAALIWVEPEDVQEAWQVFQRFRDKDWSFTDCVSRVVMMRLKIKEAFAFDDHFRQFGTVSVVP
jgi:predicted nucleic acid-binding protein